MVSIVDIIKEIQNAMRYLYSLGDIKAFISSLGYDLTPVIDQLDNVQAVASDVIKNLSTLDDAVDILLNLEDPFRANALEAIEQLIRVINSIKTIFEGLKTLSNSFSGQGFDDYISELFGNIPNADREFAVELLNRIVGSIAYYYLEKEHPIIKKVLELVGALQSRKLGADPASHRLASIEYRINWSCLLDFLGNPKEYFKTLYEWGLDSEGIYRLLELIASLLLNKMIPASVVYADANRLKDFERIVNGSFPPNLTYSPLLRVLLWEDKVTGFRIEVQLAIIPSTSSTQPPGIGLAILATISGAQEIHLTDRLLLLIDGGASFDADMLLAFIPGKSPAFSFQLSNPNVARTSIQIATKRHERSESHILFGNAEGNRFEIGSFDGMIGIDIIKDQSPEIYGEFGLNNGKIIINIGEGDGFIQRILPPIDIESNFDLTVGFSTLRGIYFRGSGKLEIIIPIHKELGPISLESIYLSISTPDSGIIPITIAVSFGAKIGPVSATVKKIGLLANLSFPKDGGNLGPINLNLGFKWPIGVGLSIDASGLTGGGFLEFDPDNGRYVGILQLAFSEIGLVAITLITTKMPDGSKGFSMLSMINVSFNPVISLPYNFKLHAVGGLLGIQRTMKIDVIRDGLKNGILDSVMFPEGDIILRAPQIISDLRTIFPPTEDRYVIGLMAKLSWCELIYGDIGLFIEVPMPIKISILGQIYTYLPSEEAPIVEIHLDILGNLDLEQKKLYLMASIYNSRILKIDLSGDAYIGVSWGNKPYFVLSLGGFHPKDKSIPSDVPALRRLMLSIGSGNNPRLSFETYFAITSATLGFGAKIELYAKAGRFSVEGYLGFDTLFIFSPFSFEVSLGAGIAVKAGGATLLSIALDMLLAGPTPWHAKGKAKFKILFFEIKVGFDVKWGKKEKATLPSVDPWPDLEEVLKHKKSWGGALPEGEQMPVLIRLNENTGTEIVVFPTGILEIRQNILPLGIKITKYKNTTPAGGISQFDIEFISIIQSNDEESSIILDTVPTLDYFARPQYQEMSDSEKLSSPAYEKLESGKRCQAREISVDIKREYELVYETEVIDENKCARILEPTSCKWIMSKYLMKGGIAAFVPIFNSGSAKYRVPVIMPKGELVEEAYAIVNTNDMTLVGSDEIPNNGNSTNVQTLQSMEEYLVNHPEKVGEIQIVPQSEVNIVNG